MKYEIQNDIPIFVDLNSLSPHFRQQVRYFEKEDRVRGEYRLKEWQKSYLRRLSENFQFKRNQVLVDVGTGSGYMAVEMAKKGLNIIACDLTLKNLIKLKKVRRENRLEKNLFLICCLAEELPIKDKIADFLVANAVLEHVLKEKRAIQEVSRVCKQKSGLMVTVPLELKYIWPFFWLPTLIHDKRIGHLRKYDKKTLVDKFGLFGYRVKKVYYPGHLEKALVVSLSILGVQRKSWIKWAELIDRRKEHKRYGATNICVIFERIGR